MSSIQNDKVTQNVLIVDDDPQVAAVLLKLLARRAVRGTVATSHKSAVDFIENNKWDLVFLGHYTLADGRGGASFELLHKIMANCPELPVVMLGRETDQPADTSGRTGCVSTAVNAVRAGCADFVVKPLDESSMDKLLETFLPDSRYVTTLASAQENMCCLYQIVGKSTALAQTIALARKVAPTSAAVLITGESGTGKELLAYLIHNESRRRNGPYIKVNCTALSDSLLESELFGHEKGAFTGAYTRRKGRFEDAHGGTLLLDEITETAPRFQAQLLRVLEQQYFERVGGNENIQVNVRVISTTNKDILQEVRCGRFRKDLYYRLAGIRLIIPPLTERTEDLTTLVWHFVNQFAGESQRRITKLDPVMMEIFNRYDWPGNVRQLRNVVRTSLILGSGEVLSLADVSWLLDELRPRRRPPWAGLDQAGPQLQNVGQTEFRPATNDDVWEALAGVKLQEIEQCAILATLHRTSGNKVKAARALGISDRTLRQKIRRYREQGSLGRDGIASYEGPGSLPGALTAQPRRVWNRTGTKCRV